MKTLFLKTSALVLFIICTSCVGDMFNSVTGNNNVTTQKRITGGEPFTQIKASNGLDVYITQSENQSVVVEADENLQDIIITEVKDGVLYIYTEKNIWKAASRKIDVSLKDISSITATSGSDVYTTSKLTTSSINVSATSGASLKLDLDATNIVASATSGADIDLQGISTSLNASATSGADINCYELKSKNVQASVTSGADIDVYVEENLVASATSGGDIDYKGNPSQVNKSSNSGGSISQK